MKARLLKVNIFASNVSFWLADHGVFKMFTVSFIATGYRGAYV